MRANRFKCASLAAVFLCGSTAAFSAAISPGGSDTISVPGTTEIYNIFGHSHGGGTAAIEYTFAAAAGNVFTFGASGTIGCCGSINSNFTPDGNPGGTSVTGSNSGLSNISGNSQIPLVGAFVNLDPFGNVAPATLAFDANSPTDLTPLLNQVFYIGDGRSGFNNAAGSILTFTAPDSATRLFLGVVDASGFGGATGFYNDNPGAFNVTVNFVSSTAPIPEPSTYALMLVGLGIVGFWARNKRTIRSTAVR